MIRPALLLGLLFCFIQVHAQTDTLADVAKLMKKKETIGDAQTRLDGYLRSHPNSVEALVLQGNLVLNKYRLFVPSVSLSANDDESIYSTEMGSLGEAPLTLPDNIANEAIAPLNKALSLDPGREDIYFGISYLYSVSLQKDKLIAYLPVLKKHAAPRPSLAYDMADYARNFIDRDRFADGMEVYKAIAGLFEENAGLYSDMAGEYFKHGNIPEAEKCTGLSLKAKGKDEMSYGNAFFIYALTENTVQAKEALKKQCDQTGAKTWMLYNALADLNDGKEWKQELKEYAGAAKENQNYHRLALFLLSDSFGDNMNSFNLITDIKLNDAYSIQIYKYYKAHVKGFLPAFKYAEVFDYNKMYGRAAEMFEAVPTDSATFKQKEDLYYFAGWANYKAGKTEKAVAYWKKLEPTDYFVYKSAACYFLGKYYLEVKKDKKTADAYFGKAADRASESKYAMFCKNLMSKK